MDLAIVSVVREAVMATVDGAGNSMRVLGKITHQKTSTISALVVKHYKFDTIGYNWLLKPLKVR